MKLGECNLRQNSEKMSWSLIKSSTMEPRKHTVTLWRHLEIPAPSTDYPENEATPAKGKHSAIVFACCVCEEYGSTGNCLFMRDSLIEMVSQRANSVCVSRRFIMLCHADLRPNKLYVFEPIDRRSGFRRSKKKLKKKKGWPRCPGKRRYDRTMTTFIAYQ